MFPGKYLDVSQGGRRSSVRLVSGFTEPPSAQEYYPDTNLDSAYDGRGHLDLSGLTTSQLQTLATAISKLPENVVSRHAKYYRKSSNKPTRERGADVPTNGRENALAERALKRAARSAQNKVKADMLKDSGNKYFRCQDYSNAANCYVQAMKLSGSVPLYHSNLAAAFLKLKLYDKAELATTSALSLDPKLVKARFRRGIARKELGLIPGAIRDFEVILRHDPTNTEAAEEMKSILMLENIENILAQEDGSVRQSDWPYLDQDKLEVASVSDTSDCNHVGNGIACRFYNHFGCAKGRACLFSHAPDEKSVRDDLGKNVCVYYLLSACRFGASKCIYSHRKDCLPKKGWWNNAQEIAQVKSFFKPSQHDARELGGILWMSRTKRRKSEKPGVKEADVNRSKFDHKRRGGNGRGKAAQKSARAPKRTKTRKGIKRGGGNSGKNAVSRRNFERLEDAMAANVGCMDGELGELWAQTMTPYAWGVLTGL